MPGNVVRGKQNYANEILQEASGQELQFVERISTNLLSRYLQTSKRLAMWVTIVFIFVQDW